MANIIDITIRAKDETGPGVASASKSGNVLQGIFQGIGQKAAGMLAELPGQALGFLKGAIDAASDLGETVSKNTTIFGAAAQELLTWAEGAPRALGMTKQAALDATGTFGNLFTQLGVNTDAARKMSQANVQLAADFASFHNADPTEVLEAMTAAYRGEFDAVQRFVPLLNAANVEEKALLMTKKSSKDALTEQDKALAVNALMMEGAGHAAGDFARTQDSASNRAKIAAASFEDMKTKIGNVLLPAWTALLGFITGSFFPAMERLGSWLGSVLGPVIDSIAQAWTMFSNALSSGMTENEGSWNSFAGAAEQVGLIVKGVFDTLKNAWAAFAGAFASGMTENEGSWDGFVNIVEQLGLIAHDVFGWLQANVPPILEALRAGFAAVVEKVTPLWEALHMNQDILIILAGIVAGVLLAAVWSLVGAMASLAISVLAATWPIVAIVAVIALVVGALRYAYENWEFFRTAVDTVVQFLITNVPPAFELIRAAIAVAVEWIVNVAVPFILQAFNSFVGFLQNTFLPAFMMVWNIASTIIGVWLGVVMEVIGRIASFITDNWNFIAGAATAVWNQITNVISTAWQIISNVIQFFLNLISGNWSGAWQNIQNIFSAIVGFLVGTAQNLASGIGNVFMLIVSFAGNMLGGIIGKLGELIGWFAGLPGRILGAIAGLAHDLFNAGVSLIQGLIDGIKSKIGAAVDVVKNGLSTIRNLMPFSPAKTGPFSGRGYTLYSGQAIASSLAEGIRDRTGLVRDAAGKLMDAANGATRSSPSFPAMVGAAAGAGAGAANTHNWYVQGSIRSDQDLVQLVRDELDTLNLVPVQQGG